MKSEKSVNVYSHFIVSDNFHTTKMWNLALVLSFINNTLLECIFMVLMYSCMETNLFSSDINMQKVLHYLFMN